MKITIVGGTFSDEMPKESGVIRKMKDAFTFNAGSDTVEVECINGGRISDLPKVVQGDVNIWMPNISNEVEKHYPLKYKGSVLICSKVMRPGYKMADAVSRIFKMQGNAVIALAKDEVSGNFIMKLIDALGNVWYNGSNIYQLATAIMSLATFTKAAKRIPTTGIANGEVKDLYNSTLSNQDFKLALNEFIELNKTLQDCLHEKCGERFFGNLSTRCQKLFPTIRVENNDYMFVSPRNSNKSSITPEDMVMYFMNDNTFYMREYPEYKAKPSVDSPIQAKLYKLFSNINYMIHGHAFILGDDIPMTKKYCLCGDMNEVDEISDVLEDPGITHFIVNLRNHGFLLGASTLDEMKDMIQDIKNKYGAKMRDE